MAHSGAWRKNKKTEIINGLKSVEPGELISIDLNNKSIKSEKIFQIENNPDELNDTNFNELMKERDYAK